MAEELERIYVIPLRKTNFKSSKAAPVAVKRVRDFLTRHMKVEKDKIWIDDSLNNALWAHGKYKMQSKIRVKAVKFEDGVVEAYIPELEFKKSRRELLKEEKEKKEPILIKEEVGAEGEGEAAGAEKYDIAPTAEGDVKIKKKKAKKEKKSKTEEETKKPEKKHKKKEEKTEEPTEKEIEPKKRERKSKTTEKTKSKPAKKKTGSKKKK